MSPASAAAPATMNVFRHVWRSMASAAATSSDHAATATGCHDAPARIVEIIDAAFTNGEHLENTQSVPGPAGMVVVGGNIVAADGTRVSSQDSWVMSNAQVYGLTSDARRHTLLPDGRDLIPDWPTYNDAVGGCVGIATRAANR